jgi:hypothetical protein
MPNVLTLTVEGPDEILNAGAYGTGALMRLQTSATEAGAFADVTGTGSTPTIAVVTLVRSYTGYDPAGASTSWYRTRFENVGATRLSDWSPAFQVGDETGALVCSVYDVWQRMNGATTIGTSDQETLLDIIRGVTSEMEDFVGAWLCPRPTAATSTMTLRFDIEQPTRSLWLRRGSRYVGIRSVTSFNLATTSQPETGGTYTAGTVADLFIRPQPVEGAQGWRLELTDYPTGAYRYFYPGYNTLEVVGAFGPSAAAPWAQEIGIAASTRRFLGKSTAATAIGLGPEGGVRLLADLPADMARRLAAHRFDPVA